MAFKKKATKAPAKKAEKPATQKIQLTAAKAGAAAPKLADTVLCAWCGKRQAPLGQICGDCASHKGQA